MPSCNIAMEQQNVSSLDQQRMLNNNYYMIKPIIYYAVITVILVKMLCAQL